MRPEDDLLTRAGWSVVTVDMAGECTGAVYGGLPWILQESGCGELYIPVTKGSLKIHSTVKWGRQRLE